MFTRHLAYEFSQLAPAGQAARLPQTRNPHKSSAEFSRCRVGMQCRLPPSSSPPAEARGSAARFRSNTELWQANLSSFMRSRSSCTAPLVDCVLPVIHPDDRPRFEGAVPRLQTTAGKLLPPVSGGGTRQESVRRGLEALARQGPRPRAHPRRRPPVRERGALRAGDRRGPRARCGGPGRRSHRHDQGGERSRARSSARRIAPGFAPSRPRKRSGSPRFSTRIAGRRRTVMSDFPTTARSPNGLVCGSRCSRASRPM